MKKWRTVILPRVLVDGVERKINKKGSGYVSISDYIAEQVRKTL